MENLKELGLLSSETIALLNKANLNWNVKTEKLVTESGLETDSIAIVREDTNKILGIHKDGYHAVQNHEVLELLMSLSKMSGYELHRGGFMKDGALIYFQLKTTDLKIGTDLIKGYATGINSHNGTTSLGLGHSNVTISCMNTFHQAYKSLEHKIKHTKNMQSKIDVLAYQLEDVIKQEDLVYKKIHRLNEIEIDSKLKDLVLRTFLDVNKNDSLGELSTRKTNIMNDLVHNIEHQTKEKGQNLWGLFSGITRYTTHGIKGTEIENKLSGIYGKKDNLVFNLLTADMEF